MTKQPVVGTIIIGNLVVLQSLWALTLALDVPFVRSLEPTHIIIVTLLALALLLILIALWPRRSPSHNEVHFSPVSEDSARAGISTGHDNVVADLRWVDTSEPLTIPVKSDRAVTVLLNPTGVALRTTARTVDIDSRMGMTWLRQDGRYQIYGGLGVGNDADARITVDVVARDLKVRST